MISWLDCSIKVDIPSACYGAEFSLLHHMCQIQDNPCVVELGPMFGGSTLAMLRGLAGKGSLHSFDWFKYDKWMDVTLKRSNSDYVLSPGDSFYNIFLENTKGYDNLKSYVADLSTPQTWTEPIDLLVIDAMKSKKIALTTAPVFFPKVRVGKWIFDQDIRFGGVYYDTMCMLYYMLRDSLVPHTYPHPGSAILFSVKRQIEIDTELWLAQDKDKALAYVAELKDSCDNYSFKLNVPIM